MKKEALDFAVAKTKELLNVPYCCAEARAAAKAMLAHAKELKAAGAKYCDCEACSAAAAIVALKDQLL